MKTLTQFLVIVAAMAFTGVSGQQSNQEEKLNTRIDNQGYWRRAAEKGLTVPNPQVSVAPATFTGSGIMAISVVTDNSPDVLLVGGSTSQSENSIFINPNDPDNPLNSNNSTSQPGGGITLYGADYLYSFDAGLNWEGSIQGAGGSNSGDPAALIGRNGRYYINFINNQSGQSVARSDDQGATWQSSVVANAPSGFSSLLDKNHMWIDNSPTSPYEGNLYNAWTTFGGQNDNDIEISRSEDDGVTWSTPINVSNSINAGSHSQGVNVQTGPNGEVYAIFTIYDNWPSDEDALGMARSLDGGMTYSSFRIIDNIRGIRNSGTSKDMRVNSFPVAAVDISNSSRRGNIYVVWTNIGYPGINTGSDRDVYIIRSEDDGDTWSAPVRVNQDTPGLGKQHYLPWITCDPVTGTLSVVFYDDRNVGSTQCEVWCANSYDGGDTWEDFKVSDVSFTPSPIPGLASGYFGDYLGIAARNGNVYPVWTDNRTGTALTYTSPYQTSTISPPTNLVASLDEETGEVALTWQHSPSPTFSYYKIYRGLQFLGTSVLPLFNDQLPTYGSYRYFVTAFYEAEGESGSAIVDVQWGNPQAVVDPGVVEVFLAPETSSTVNLVLANAGELPLDYDSRFTFPGTFTPASRAYCTGTGGCGEFIVRVQFNEVLNQSECGGYQDFTALSTTLATGESMTVTVRNGNLSYPADVCGIWVDWNQNENFLDDQPVTVTGSPGVGPYSATITVPEGAATGPARMRIRIKRDAPVSPCGLTPNGEVEDYTINVIGWVSATPMEGTVEAGENQTIAMTFNATGMDLGTYEANYIISSNDPDNGEITVPVVMHVTDIALTATADKYEICQGGATTLHAQATGGSGSYSFSWTSDPPGFTSTDPDPVVMPEVTTTYFVEMTDAGLTLQEEVTITVRDLPVVDLGNDMAACEGGQAEFDAGEGFASYLWSTGANTQTILVSEPGIYWVEVANAYTCSSRDTVEFTTYPLPVVSLGDDRDFCEGTSVMLDAGSEFSTYLWSTGDESYYINVNEPGEYWVIIADANGCMDSDTVVLAMDPLPSTPGITSGPASVDNFLSPSSVYTASTGANATGYEWTLEPSNAGILTANGTSAEVTWASGFTGNAQLSIRSVNDCGASPYSPIYETAVYSSQSIHDMNVVGGITVYPNPSEGNFTLKFDSAKAQTLQFRISTAGGARILDDRESIPAGAYQKEFNLGTLPAGTYNLTISDANGRLISRQQVVLK